MTLRPYCEECDIDVDLIFFYCAKCDEKYELPETVARCPVCGHPELKEI